MPKFTHQFRGIARGSDNLKRLTVLCDEAYGTGLRAQSRQGMLHNDMAHLVWRERPRQSRRYLLKAGKATGGMLGRLVGNLPSRYKLITSGLRSQNLTHRGPLACWLGNSELWRRSLLTPKTAPSRLRR